MWGSSPVLRAFPTSFIPPLTWNLRLPGEEGEDESFLTQPCTPLSLPSKELVVQKGWRLPEYTVTQESGPAHRKEFTMTCRVERFVEIGNRAEGSSYSYSSPGRRQLLASLCQSPAVLAEPLARLPSSWLLPCTLPFAPLLADQVLRCMAGPELLFPTDIP